MAITRRKIMLAAGWAVLGAIFAPIAFVAALALLSSSDDNEEQRLQSAAKLVESYQARLPPNLLFLSITPPEDGAECGYDAQELFGEGDYFSAAIESDGYTDYAGYYALDWWRRQSRNEEYVGAIVMHIAETRSLFEVEFLRRCMEATVFSPFCTDAVAQFGDDVQRFDHARDSIPMAGFGIEDDIVCTYADGVAARNDLPIAQREAR